MLFSDHLVSFFNFNFLAHSFMFQESGRAALRVGCNYSGWSHKLGFNLKQAKKTCKKYCWGPSRGWCCEYFSLCILLWKGSFVTKSATLPWWLATFKFAGKYFQFLISHVPLSDEKRCRRCWTDFWLNLWIFICSVVRKQSWKLMIFSTCA